MKKQREFISLVKYTMLFLLIAVIMAGCGSISDGEYTASVTLSGGSGKAHIDSPCRITVNGGKATADITWSSSNYDYMIVNGKTYYPVNTEGNSEFIIPVVLEKDMQIQADTVAMSKPHLIDYVIRFSITKQNESLDDASDGKNEIEASNGSVGGNNISKDPELNGPDYISTDENSYAKNFAIHRYSDDFAVISVDDGRNYLIVPEDKDYSEDVGDDVIILKKPMDRIYLAASGVMCQFDAVSSVQDIYLSGIDKDDWYIESARKAMDEGTLIYGGKYSAPDYERMVADDINLAIENTMILHVPKAQEKIEQLGIPVFIDRSSYENDPLGRCEWVKVYGLIAGKEKEALDAFEEQKKLVEALNEFENTEKTVVIFSVNSNHQIVTRKKNDYFSKMVEIAGGKYLSPSSEDDEKANSQVTISTESFYAYAENADILIYNTSIEEVPQSLQSLMDTDPTFASFKAFNDGTVFYTDKSLYQYADKTGTIIDNLNKIITNQETDTEFFHKLN
ncbi:iron complex transport system substrate-binding protein [Butyrivibrio sp. ob235]|uniref:ABC transporter substrate-binding protein n=1 Tax=Butyrivibrio sp. ob235 TaxID=1761780 RepID=UPI0008BD9E0B|nr:ABC transporter substrate-binding protein [Butyrivibrio sp. ob235]SEK23087.1 iron complex transport system substrate-binding protein [Butyrivibrio sp. ob235]